ncbi:MAG: hypothetical protein AAF846_05355 [Chloroflexota bacterium]
MKLPLLFLCILVLSIFVTACSNTNNIEEFPLSDTKPTLLVFCNNTDVSCFDLEYIATHLKDQFGEESLSTIYLFVDGVYGARIFEILDLPNIPSYVVFSSEQEEVYRSSGDVDLDELDIVFSDLLSN